MFMYDARTCCDVAKATCTSRIVALKAQLAKQTNGENLSTQSDVKAMVAAHYQLEPAAHSQHVLRVYNWIVALKALMAKKTYGARLSTPSGVKASVETLVVACYRSVF